ncbi:hypothetical protein K502DRAFT_325510 [Neoconidiobolus thromboides FSU 785]|nr:hypothetical protein K502DRAFT_325510 [Neoconidiobolus thromboides FSU 785]
MKYSNIIALLLSASIVSAHNDYNGGRDPYEKDSPSKSCKDKTVTKTVCLTKTVSACPNPIPSNIYENPESAIFRKHKNNPGKNGIRRKNGDYKDPYVEEKETDPYHKTKKEKEKEKETDPYHKTKKEKEKETNPYKEEEGYPNDNYNGKDNRPKNNPKNKSKDEKAKKQH